MTPGYPVVHDFLPDIAGFYAGWLGRELPVRRGAGLNDESVGLADAESFRRDGAVVLRGALDPDQVELLAAGVERNLAAPSELGDRTEEPGAPGAFFEDFCNWQRIAEFERR